MLKKYFLITAIFIVLAYFMSGRFYFSDLLYSYLVFYFGFIFIIFSQICCLNVYTLYRYDSINKFYIKVFENIFQNILLYVSIYSVVGVAAGLISGDFKMTSMQIAQFIIIAIVNLMLLSILWFTLKVWLGNVKSTLCIVLSIAISMTLSLEIKYTISPFIFNITFMEIHKIFLLRYIISYLMLIMIIAVIYLLSKRGDKCLT